MRTAAPITSVGVLLMTYGSPSSTDGVSGYLRRIYGDRPLEDAVVTEMSRRYELIGGSPLVSVTRAQAAALEAELRSRHPRYAVTVRAGMRFSEPFIADAVGELPPTIGRMVGIIMSPQYSDGLMSGYRHALEAAAAERFPSLSPAIAGDWSRDPGFVAAVAAQSRAGMARAAALGAVSPPMLFTAHSLPRRVADSEPQYIAALEATAHAVASHLGLDAERWSFCYQSAGHTREEWLTPDLGDMVHNLGRNGATHVVVVPVQFLADHLEVLYDIDVAAAAAAAAAGVTLVRAPSLNASAPLVAVLAGIVETHALDGQSAIGGAAARP